MAQEIKIEKGVKMPTFSRGIRNEFAKLEVGDSFVIASNKKNAIISNFYQWAKEKKYDWKLGSKNINDSEIRIWRTK